jgi:hypothetical protein
VAKKRATKKNPSVRKTKKFLKRKGYTASAKSAAGRKLKRLNPPMRKVPNSGTGWIKAARVKIVRRPGKPAQVIIQKPRRK